MKYSAVVWDWNGTLLNDIDASVSTLNRMLSGRGLIEVSLEEYRKLFGFPVRAYYEAVGFDFERDDWHEVSTEYVDTYESLVGGAELTDHVVDVLDGIRKTGLKQYVLSALKEELLIEVLERYGIIHYFTGVCGSNNIYADGKVARGQQMLADFQIEPTNTLMIGDTLHDAEVAEALGFDVCLFAGGHNNAERLKSKGKVVYSLDRILEEIR